MSAGQLTAQRHSNMSENCSLHDAQDCGNPKHRGVCDKWLVGLVLLTLARASEALAGEQPVIAGETPRPDFGTSRQPPDSALTAPTVAALLPSPDFFQPITIPATQIYSAAEFRPRGHSVFDTEPRDGVPQEAPMLLGTTVWQRLSDYRSRDRVRLLTLWETAGSSLSLQAGRKGSPSLQWTSRLMNRGGATRGVLDKVFEASVANAATRLHLAPRPPVGDILAKPSKLAEGAQEK